MKETLRPLRRGNVFDRDYLRECARTFVRCRDAAAEHDRTDGRCELLLLMLSLATGHAPGAYELLIEDMAR